MKKQRINLIIALFIVILFTFTFNVTSSRYIGQLESKAEDVNAIPIINLDNPTFQEEITSMLPGDISESDFYISNYEEAKTNEILMKYYIKIQLNSEIPLKVSLTDESGKELTLDNEGKTQEIELTYGRQVKTKYHIKIEWDAKNNEDKYAGKSAKLTIDLVSNQVVEEA